MILSISDVITNSSDELFIVKSPIKDPKEYIKGLILEHFKNIDIKELEYDLEAYSTDIEALSYKFDFRDIMRKIDGDIHVPDFYPEYDGTTYLEEDRKWLITHKKDIPKLAKKYQPHLYKVNNNKDVALFPPSFGRFVKDLNKTMNSSPIMTVYGLQPYMGKYLGILKEGNENIYER